LTNFTLSLAWKSSITKKQGLDAFTPIDITKGLFEIYYTTEMLSNQGVLSVSLVLVTTSGKLESEEFKINVSKSVVDEEAMQSENSFTMLTQALVQLNQYQRDIDDIKDDLNTQVNDVVNTHDARLNTLYNTKEST